MSRVAAGSVLNHDLRCNGLSRRIASEAQRLQLQVGQGAPQPLHWAEAKASRPPLTHDDLHGEDHHRPSGDGTWSQSKGLAEAVHVHQQHAEQSEAADYINLDDARGRGNRFSFPSTQRSILAKGGHEWQFDPPPVVDPHT